MKRLALTLLGTLALAAVARPAAAQTAPALAFSQNLEVRVDGEELKNDTIVYIGSTLCQKTTPYTFRGVSYNTGGDSIASLELWASSGSVNCQQASNRVQNTTSTAQCWLVGTIRSVSTTAMITVTAPEIFKAGANDDSGVCPQVTNTAYTVYFVPLASPSANNPSAPPEPIMGIQQLKATFTLNQVTPEAPAIRTKDGEGEGDGENELKVEWAKSPDAKAKSQYYVLWDLGIGPDPSCSESILVAKQPPPDPDDDEYLLKSDYTPGTKMTLDHLDERGVAVGDYVAATVIHQDVAGNVSNMSRVVCLSRKKTLTGIDVCAMDPDCRPSFSTCALTPGQRRGGALVGVLFTLGSLLFLRRRRA